jgi:predicted negative regulator of RcsB-dependent stress response
MPVIDQAKDLVSQNPTVAIVIMVLLIVVIIANYFNFNPWKRTVAAAKKDEEKSSDEVDKLIDSINTKQDTK